MADGYERFYTRAAQQAALKLTAAHRKQEREAAEAAERERSDGLDPGFKRMQREQKLQGKRTRKVARTPRGYA